MQTNNGGKRLQARNRHLRNRCGFRGGAFRWMSSRIFQRTFIVSVAFFEGLPLCNGFALEASEASSDGLSLSQAAASHKSSQRGQQYNILWK